MMTTLELTKPRPANYTAASLIIEWAREHAACTPRNAYGELFILLDKPYKYDHWSIADNGDGTETVTVYLISA